MQGFDHVLNWKLKQGSHPFPGKDGGTCINEAALVAEGFEYRPIRQAEDMPDCFSRPICRFAMLLNDQACDSDRQRLLPFVTRLACADGPEVERARAAYINRHMRTDFGEFPFDRGLKVLEGALAIGRQANSAEIGEVKSRMEAVQAKATTPTSVPESPLLAKIKSWFGAKDAEPVA
ncbi:hypothetical protein [Salinarimonas soli]|nr:hypothetical protein [Salinarimonas soli]